jgi:hypothetical protein
MVVSQGFYRKIKDWIYSEQYEGIRFRPFQTSGNPYKAKCFLVSAYPDSILNISDEEVTLYAEALLDRKLFAHLYGETCDSKETRAIERFITWYDAIEASPIVVTYMNSLQVNGLPALKLAKKERTKDYVKGERLFNEVLLEFLPNCIIIHGNEALKMFRQQYSNIMIDYHQSITKAQDLEEVGPFAEICLLSGHRVFVFACRHMSNYTDKSLQHLKKCVENVVKTER